MSKRSAVTNCFRNSFLFVLFPQYYGITYSILLRCIENRNMYLAGTITKQNENWEVRVGKLYMDHNLIYFERQMHTKAQRNKKINEAEKLEKET